MISETEEKELNRIACEIRLSLLRMFSFGKAHHFGGSFSCADVLTALYFYKMNYGKSNFTDPGRDRFIMSKGHSVPTQYVILAKLGILDEDDLLSIKQFGSRLQGHPDIHKTLGIEAPTGSLGQGLSYANGIALSGQRDGRPFNTYVMMGDGELQEGQAWEAAMTTSQYSLNNVTVIVDNNKYQSQGSVDEIKSIEPIDRRFEAFGWHSIRIDGHNMKQICDALDESSEYTDKPVAIIADTVKGKGISFIEGTYKYHNYSLSREEFLKAEAEILDTLSTLKL